MPLHTAYMPGASPETIEQEVTFPLENAILGLPNVKNIRSKSFRNRVNISVNLVRDGQPPETTLENIRGRIDSIRSILPNNIENITSYVSKIDTVDAYSLSLIPFDANNSIHYQWLEALKQELLSLPKIVRVETKEPKRALYFELYPEKIAEYGLTVEIIQNKIRNYLQSNSLGSVNQNGRDIIIDMDRVKVDPKYFEKLPVHVDRFGYEVILADISEVSFRSDRLSRYSPVNGEKGVFVQAFSDTDVDFIEVTQQVRNRVGEFKKRLPEPLRLVEHSANGDFIGHQVGVLGKNAIIGFLLVILILTFFVGVKPAIVTALGLPVAYLGTLIALKYFGISFNLITIMAMIVIVGILVDDAIVVTERYSKNLESGMTPKGSAVDAATSLMKPITGTILTTIVAYIPILMLDHDISDWFFAVPIVIISALLFSWLECFFVLPNHLAHYVNSPKALGGGIMQAMINIYDFFLKYILKLRYLVLLTVVSGVGFSLYFFSQNLRLLFDLPIGAPQHKVFVQLNESSSIDETAEKTKKIETFLIGLKEDYDIDVVGIFGEAYINGYHKKGYEYSEFTVYSKAFDKNPLAIKNDIAKKINLGLKDLKNDQISTLELVSNNSSNRGGLDHAVSINFKSTNIPDYNVLEAAIMSSIRGVEGLKKVSFNEEVFVDSWVFTPNHKALSSYGLSTTDVTQQIAPIFSPVKLGQTRFQGVPVNVYTEVNRRDNMTFEEVSALTLTTARGTVIPVSSVGVWEQIKKENQIRHLDGLRLFAADIIYDPSKTDLLTFKGLVAQRLDLLREQFPSYDISVASSNEQLDEAQIWVMKVGAISIFMIYLILSITLNSLTKPFLILWPIPLGFVGVGWSFYLHDMTMSMISFIGLIGVAGVAVNDSLIMVYGLNEKTNKEDNSRVLTIRRAVTGRFRAITLTTITALAGLLPMAYGIGGDSGFTNEIAFAMGWGLLSSTLATLVCIPVLAVIREDTLAIIRFFFGLYSKFRSPSVHHRIKTKPKLSTVSQVDL